jgi:cytochrome c
LGHAPHPDEIKAWDFAIGPDGKELPPGSGSAAEGAKVYAAQCAGCHGKTGKEGPNDVLVGGQGTLNTAKPVKTVGSYWPYATTVWDYINRAMPYNKPGSLSASEVYSLTAYLLSLNGIIKEDAVLNAKTLPQVQMPNRNGFIGDPRPDWKSSAR